MTTKIADVITGLYTLVSTVLSSYNELADPYTLEGNTELFLKKGFGIAIETGSNRQDLAVSCQIWTQRSFTVYLTNKITTTRENTSSMKALQKSIMDDQDALIEAAYDDSTLGGKAQDIIYTSDTGIEYLDIQGIKYFRLGTTFDVTYIKQT